MCRDFLLISVLRIRQLVVLELSSFLPFRACFGFEYLGELFLSWTILLEAELVLFEIQCIRDGRPVIPILTISLLLKLIDTAVKRFHLMFLLHKVQTLLD